MGWADTYIAKLQAGETVQFRPRGNSMTGKISSGQLCTVVPATTAEAGDIVLCRVRGAQYLHLVKAVKQFDGAASYKIGNNHGHINGWTHTIYGKLVKVEP